MTEEEVKARISELRTRENEVNAQVQAARVKWLSFTNLGQALREHQHEQHNLAARELHRFSWELAEVQMEIDSWNMVLSSIGKAEKTGH
jgi:GTP1/Obg family GTP-binding protein